MDEAAPYYEVQANPYCFMATTGIGGHLSWFEGGGGRWFARAVCTPIVLALVWDASLLFPQIVTFLQNFQNEVVEVLPINPEQGKHSAS